MRAKELVPILAERWAVPFETAFTIDRALMNAGLRQKGRGRAYPEMTRKEALLFLIGCMAAEKATQAADDVKAWQAATGIYPLDPSEKAPDDDGYDEWYFDSGNQVRMDYYVRINPKLSQFATNGGHLVGLMDFMLVVCDLLETGSILCDSVKLSVSHSHQSAEVTFFDMAGNSVEGHSFHTDRQPEFHDDLEHTQIIRSASVYGDALMEICARTENPLAEAE
ncbi:MAG: hypothetical protein KDK89_23530 [Alphaproteobacteria bacterium]|nr:hypothetical protein [Alphaproteobacteria bacterium]